MTEESRDDDMIHTAPPDADNDSSAESVGKPLSTFDTQDDSDLEDGPSRSFSSRRSRSSSWWHTMVLRARRKISLDDLKNGLDQALLQDSFSASRRARRKRTWYNYCIFGGISGLTIL
jgi:hypothetical protein